MTNETVQERTLPEFPAPERAPHKTCSESGVAIMLHLCYAQLVTQRYECVRGLESSRYGKC